MNRKQETKISLVKVSRNFQITIPNNMRKNLSNAVGDYLEVERHEEGLKIRAIKIVDAEQAYFYTKEWQAVEAEADKDIVEGNLLGPFDNAQDAIRTLKTAKL